MKKKNIILLSCIVLIIIVLGVVILNGKNNEDKLTDAYKFHQEYSKVDENNVFVYRDVDKIINILEKGTGLVYLGFPECPWCQSYTKYLNEVATDLGVKKIYYYNIRQDRNDNTEDYKKIVSILSDYLQDDEEGNKRIYAPCVIALKKGEIVGFDDETSWDTKGFTDPSDYWTDEEIKDLKDKLETMIADSGSNVCTECN